MNSNVEWMLTPKDVEINYWLTQNDNLESKGASVDTQALDEYHKHNLLDGDREGFLANNNDVHIRFDLKEERNFHSIAFIAPEDLTFAPTYIQVSYNDAGETWFSEGN